MGKQQINESYISRFITKAPTALYDIGVGPKTEWQTLGRIYKQMQLFGCEPDAQQFRELSEVFPGSLLRVAIAETEGTATLHIPNNDRKCCSLIATPYSDHTQTVNTITLDQFDEWAGRQHRILLWIDIEGFELAAFRSGPNLFASGRVRWINLEERRAGHLPGNGWCAPEDTHAFLTENGYLRLRSYNKHVTHQDVIYIHKTEKAKRK